MISARPTWHGCYDQSWKGLIVDEAFAHPAKFARGLIGRIYGYLMERQWLMPGETVVDPFGGVALGAMDCMSVGCRWVGCELEPRFVELGNRNIALWRDRWGLNGATLLQGDSRRLCEVVAGADVVLSSPPYAEVASRERSKEPWAINKGSQEYGDTDASRHVDGYGHSPGQLGAMPPGTVDAVVSSPPYAQHGLGNRNTNGCHFGVEPLEKSLERERQNKETELDSYGSSPGQLASLPPGSVADCVVSSPPFSDPGCQPAGNMPSRPVRSKIREMGLEKRAGEEYGKTNGQLGAETGETFWHAARQIVQQCHAILKPQGVAVFVCKDFVRKGERVPFSADWVRLCEACGFELVEWIHASLVKETRHSDLFDGEQVKVTQKKSFFRRLAEKKGSPRIDHEDLLFLRRLP